MKAKILSIEDDPTISELIRRSLTECDVSCLSSIKEAQTAMAQKKFDLVLIDIDLPDGNGIHFIAENINTLNAVHTSFIFITGDSKMANKVIAFNLGAEDFIQKPFDPTELNARVNSKLRKKNAQNASLTIADLIIDLEKFKVFQKQKNYEKNLELTIHELKILQLLAQYPEKIYSRQQILDAIWSDISISDRTIDSHIAHLRKKIANSKVQINTIKSIGYQLSIKKSHGELGKLGLHTDLD